MFGLTQYLPFLAVSFFLSYRPKLSDHSSGGDVFDVAMPPASVDLPWLNFVPSPLIPDHFVFSYK
jgi:hypothetical protein